MNTHGQSRVSRVSGWVLPEGYEWHANKKTRRAHVIQTDGTDSLCGFYVRDHVHPGDGMRCCSDCVDRMLDI